MDTLTTSRPVASHPRAPQPTPVAQSKLSRILVTGGTGFIGQALVKRLLIEGYRVTVLTRHPKRHAARVNLNYTDRLHHIEQLDRPDVLINLAGEPLTSHRWSTAHKLRIRRSRVRFTQDLFEEVQSWPQVPRLLISASATAYYGPHDRDQALDERGETEDCFSHQLCRDWEAAAQQFETLGTRVCCLRSGMVLGSGGLFQQLKMPFDYGVATQIGDGEQSLSWIHLQDLLGIILFAMRNRRLSGPINACAPHGITHREFTDYLQQFKKTYVRMPMPAPLLSLLMGEFAKAWLLNGQQAVPKKLLDHQFHFNYARFPEALDNLLKKTTV